MKNTIPVWAVIIAGLLALAGLLYFSLVSPLLYSPENAKAETRFQLNTDALTPAPINSTTDVYPLMQDLLDQPGSITLNIRLRDPASAQADLAAYLKTYKNLDNVVLNLDMTDSEIENFTKSADLQDELFSQLLNETGTLDSLKNLEVRYRDSNDPDMVVSVQYQGAALQKRMSDLYAKYKAEHGANLAIGQKYGLLTAKYNQSLDDFQRIVIEAQEQFGSGPVVPVKSGSSGNPVIILAIDPDTAVYRDTIRFIGYLYPVTGNNTPVAILLDGSSLQNITADAHGEFTGSFVVEKIPAGPHMLVAEAEGVTSRNTSLEVLLVNSTTTLDAYADTDHIAALCNGTVIANLPVRFAPVSIIENNRTIFNATTDENGIYNVSVPVSYGRHLLIARFDSQKYPVNASESEPAEIVLEKPVTPSSATSPGGFSFVSFLIGVCIVSFSAAGAFLYFRKKTAPVPEEPEEKSSRGQDTVSSDQGIAAPEMQEVLHQASESTKDGRLDLQGLFEKTESEQGISTAAFTVYRVLAGRAADLHHIDRFVTQTPRQMAALCMEEPFGQAFSRFVYAYEIIRYAGKTDPETRSLFLDALSLAANLIMGDRT